MKKIILFIFCNWLMSSSANAETDIGPFSQKIEIVRKTLVNEFSDEEFDNLDPHMSDLGRRWWKQKIKYQGFRERRSYLFSKVLQETKFIFSELPCPTDLGPKPACQYINEQQINVIHFQNKIWEDTSITDLKILLIHEIGHALQEDDHSLLILLGKDLLQAQNLKNEAKQLDHLNQDQQARRRAVTLHHSLGQVNTKTSSDFDSLDFLVLSRLFAFKGFAIAPAEISFNHDFSNYQIRLGGTYSFTSYFCDGKGRGFCIGLMPLSGILLGVYFFRKNDWQAYQIHIFNASLGFNKKLSSQDFLTFDAHLGMTPDSLMRDEFGMYLSSMLNFSWIHHLNDYPLFIGGEYLGEFILHPGKFGVKDATTTLFDNEFKLMFGTTAIDLLNASVFLSFENDFLNWHKKQVFNIGFQIKF